MDLLLVDDSKTMRLLVHRAIRQAGYQRSYRLRGGKWGRCFGKTEVAETEVDSV